MSVINTLLFSGFLGQVQTPEGVLWQNNSLYGIPNSLFLSYLAKRDQTIYVVDENYDPSMGSSVYKLYKSLQYTRSISNPQVLGGVFILVSDPYIYVPGFQSNNIWIIDQNLDKTISIVSTGYNPHSIYIHQDIFYVLCRGAEDRKQSNFIYRYSSLDLSNCLPVIDLEVLSHGEVAQSGPRHGVFVKDSFFIITEFTHQIVEINVSDPSNPVYIQSTIIEPQEGTECTGAEIRFLDPYLYVSLRQTQNGLPVEGKLYRYTLDLMSFSFLEVGKTPRFFNIVNSTAIVLNTDSQSYTMIDLTTWKVIGNNIPFDPSFSPQCFV